MLRQLSRDKQWYTPVLMSTQQACAGLHREGYLERRALPSAHPRFEYHINLNSPILLEARALGIVL